MTTRDRQYSKVLIVLIGVLGITLWFGYRINRPQTASAVPPTAPQTPLPADPQSGARIRIDMVQTHRVEDEIGANNVFQYRSAGSERSTGSGSSPLPGGDAPAPAPPVVTAPVPTSPPGPPLPPPPPIPFKYNGFAVTDSEVALTAFLADDLNHYNVTVGEVLMGRYRISRITDTDVEVEDLQLNRRQILPLIRQ